MLGGTLVLAGLTRNEPEAGFTFSDLTECMGLPDVDPENAIGLPECDGLAAVDAERFRGERVWRSLMEEKVVSEPMAERVLPSKSMSNFWWSSPTSNSREPLSVFLVRTASSFACKVATSRQDEVM